MPVPKITGMIGVFQRFINKIFRDLFKRKKQLKLGLYGPPNGGKCVTPDTEVVLANGRALPIKELFDHVNGQKGQFDITTSSEVIIQCEDLNLQVPSFDLRELKIVNKKVTHLYAQKYSGIIYQMRTSSGRVIKTTPVHPLIRLSDTGVEKTRAEDLRLNDSIAIAQNLKLTAVLQLNSVIPQMVALADGTVQAISAYHEPKIITA